MTSGKSEILFFQNAFSSPRVEAIMFQVCVFFCCCCEFGFFFVVVNLVLLGGSTLEVYKSLNK